MAIYKLNELVYATRGNSTFQKKDLELKYFNNSYVALHYGKTYKVEAVNIDFSYYVDKKFFKDNQVVRNKDTVLVSTSETLEDLGHSYIYLRDDIGLLGGEQILLNANTMLILPEYLFYLTKQLKPQFRKYATGMKVYRFKIEDFKFIDVDIPPLKEQQKIIDIIKPVEKLYLKYSNTVRIDNIENCKADVINLIDIIKPIEHAINNVKHQIQEIKKILKTKYVLSSGHQIEFLKLVNVVTETYDNQKLYLATNAIGELSTDKTKIQNILEDRPSRANLTPQNDSIIFSKLDGENKVLYIDDNFDYVVSTGFFNVSTEHLDHVIGFLLSEEFKLQKTQLATGTTMMALNNASLKKIMIKSASNKDIELVKLLNKMLIIEDKLSEKLKNSISLLIK